MMPTLLRCLFLLLLTYANAYAEALPDVIYWDTPAGKQLRAHMSADADYWALSPNFTAQVSQSYCSVASAITVLNSLPIQKPVDPRYAPYAYFTQENYFSPQVSKVIEAQTVLQQGMTREEMTRTLNANGAQARSIAGDTLTDDSLRELLQRALGDDGQFVLANYLRAVFHQVGGGHWSALAAYDAESDHVLILDVAKYKYPPVWVSLHSLREAIATLDSTSGQSRGLVLVSVPE